MYDPLPDEQGSANNEPRTLSLAEETIRRGFIRKVYGILFAQMLLTAAVAAPIAVTGKAFVMDHAYLMYIAIGINWACLCAMMCSRDLTRKYPMNYAFLGVFTASMGVLVGFSSAMVDPQSLMLAVVTTSVIFGCMTLFAHTTNIDFTGYGAYFFGALIALSAFSGIIMILKFCGVAVNGMMICYDCVGVLLFTMFIVYDTQCILGGKHKQSFEVDEYVFAALNLYVDIIDLFIMLLDLFSDRQ